MFMQNIDFFTALLQVPGSYQVPVDSPNIDRYLTGYTWCLNCESSGIIVISVFKYSRFLYDVTLRVSNRYVLVLDICYSSSALSNTLLFRPDELKQTVPFLFGKFKTYEFFLKSFYRSILVLDDDFFSNICF